MSNNRRGTRRDQRHAPRRKSRWEITARTFGLVGVCTGIGISLLHLSPQQALEILLRILPLLL